MSAVNRTIAISNVLLHEGGYTNDPKDPGGPTNWGITIADARMYWKPNATAADVKAMPKIVAISIYQQKYWAKIRADELRGGVDYALMDYGVNSGVGRAGKVLRRLMRLPDNTSAFSDELIRTAGGKDPHELVNAICDERMRFLRGLKTFDHFGKGWTRRVAEVRAYAITLANKDVKLPEIASPSITPTAANEVQAKGVVPAPKAVQKIITATPTAAGAGAGATWHDWVAAHPWETGLIVTGGVVMIGGGVYALHRWHANKQEAIPLGWTPPDIQDAPVIPVAA